MKNNKQDDTGGMELDDFFDEIEMDDELVNTNQKNQSILSRVNYRLFNVSDEFYVFYIRKYRSLKAKMLEWIWKVGFLQGKQHAVNNEFLNKFTALDEETKLAFMQNTSVRDVIEAFAFSSNELLCLMLKCCSRRAAEMILHDILNVRYANLVGIEECNKTQQKLLEQMFMEEAK